MLKVENIDVSYGDLQVLWDVSIEVSAHEIVALVGSNGAGKTTLLKTISRLLPVQKGRLLMDSFDFSKLPAPQVIELGITLVPEGRRLFPEMSVWENLMMGGFTSAARSSRPVMLEKVFDLFPRLGERKKQLAGTLSGGEQQMLAIGRGLMSQPRLMILDEPSLGLSPILVSEIFHIIKNIQTEGMTVLIVEQNTRQTLGICDRGYVLENGRVVLEGTGPSLLSHDHIKKAYLGI